MRSAVPAAAAARARSSSRGCGSTGEGRRRRGGSRSPASSRTPTPTWTTGTPGRKSARRSTTARRSAGNPTAVTIASTCSQHSRTCGGGTRRARRRSADRARASDVGELAEDAHARIDALAQRLVERRIERGQARRQHAAAAVEDDDVALEARDGGGRAGRDEPCRRHRARTAAANSSPGSSPLHRIRRGCIGRRQRHPRRDVARRGTPAPRILHVAVARGTAHWTKVQPRARARWS